MAGQHQHPQLVPNTASCGAKRMAYKGREEMLTEDALLSLYAVQHARVQCRHEYRLSRKQGTGFDKLVLFPQTKIYTLGFTFSWIRNQD